MNPILVSPSFLAANFGQVKKEVEMLNESVADYIHIDIMDGVFVPNISYGFPVTKAINSYANKPLDFHLMIDRADDYLEECVNSGAKIISVHYEACPHLHRTVSRIKDLGSKAGVAINPHTSVSVLESILNEVDLVLIMSVNPGFGGQTFIERTYDKVRQLREMSMTINPELIIEVDGGVNMETGKKLVESGANMLVAGSFVFKSENPVDTIQAMKNL